MTNTFQVYQNMYFSFKKTHIFQQSLTCTATDKPFTPYILNLNHYRASKREISSDCKNTMGPIHI